jgi:hypothetical protein
MVSTFNASHCLSVTSWPTIYITMPGALASAAARALPAVCNPRLTYAEGANLACKPVRQGAFGNSESKRKRIGEHKPRQVTNYQCAAAPWTTAGTHSMRHRVFLDG